MLKLFVFWGLFALVVTGVVVTLIRERTRKNIEREYARQRSAKAAKPETRPLPKQHASVKERSAIPSAATPAAGIVQTGNAANHKEPAFDPNATRIHFGASSESSTSGVSAVEAARDEMILPTVGSARLVCVGGRLKGKNFPITTTGITVGRDPENIIAIADARISSHHAWVGIVDSKAVLRDLGSTNGTFLNAHMGSMVQEVVLSPGDTIFFGGHGGDQFRFVVD